MKWTGKHKGFVVCFWSKSLTWPLYPRVDEHKCDAALLPFTVWCVRRGFLRRSTASATRSWSTCLRVSRRRSTCVLSWSTQLEATWWCTSTLTFSLSPGLCEWALITSVYTWLLLSGLFSLLFSSAENYDSGEFQYVFWLTWLLHILLTNSPQCVILWIICMCVLGANYLDFIM